MPMPNVICIVMSVDNQFQEIDFGTGTGSHDEDTELLYEQHHDEK